MTVGEGQSAGVGVTWSKVKFSKSTVIWGERRSGARDSRHHAHEGVKMLLLLKIVIVKVNVLGGLAMTL